MSYGSEDPLSVFLSVAFGVSKPSFFEIESWRILKGLHSYDCLSLYSIIVTSVYFALPRVLQMFLSE